MTKVLIYTDFDGTITGRVGFDTVSSDFYQSLLQNYKKGAEQNYKTTPLKDENELQNLFETHFGTYKDGFNYEQEDADILMTAEAVTFFKNVLNNPDISVNIFTKNRSDYIKSLFKYHGFSQEEISQLQFDESGGKGYALHMSLMRPENIHPTHIYILDDSKSDYIDMTLIAEDALFKFHPDQIKKYNNPVGQFEWGKYQKDIEAIFTHPVEYKPYTPIPLINIEEGSASNSDGYEDYIPIGGEISCENTSNNGVILEENTPKDDALSTGHDDTPLAGSQFHPLMEQPVFPELKNGPAKEVASVQTSGHTLKITGLFFSIGFILGFIIGSVLTATGLFAPFGLSLYGALGLGGCFAGGLGLLTGSGSYGIARITEPQITTNLCDEPAKMNHTSSQSMKGLGGTLIRSGSNQSLSVTHFPAIIKKDINKPGNIPVEETGLNAKCCNK